VITTHSSSLDPRPVLRAAALPLLFLGALLAVEELSFLDPWTETAETSRLVAMLGTAVWLLTAVAVTVCRLRRDTLAHQRLQELRDRSQASGRALVYVQTVVSSSSAGQHAVVVNVATGHRYRLWLPEVDLPIGAYVVIEQRVIGLAVLDWAGSRQVGAAHRYERRHPAREDSVKVPPGGDDSEDRGDARRLIEETEQFLRQQ